MRKGKAVKRRRGPARKVNNAASAYNQSFDEAYNEGYNAGFAKGFEDGHQLAYEQQP
jgi:flagellar biosynthesis/type III secretory pathway protein FliH